MCQISPDQRAEQYEQSSLRDEKRFRAKFEELLRTAWQQDLEHST